MRLIIIIIAFVFFGTGCTMKTQCFIFNDSPHTIEVKTWRYLFPDTQKITTGEHIKFNTLYFVVPDMQITIPETGEVFYYSFKTGETFPIMRFHEKGVIEFQKSQKDGIMLNSPE